MIIKGILTHYLRSDISANLVPRFAQLRLQSTFIHNNYSTDSPKPTLADIESLEKRYRDILKRPTPVFTRFLLDRISELRKNNPGKRITEITKQLGQEWRSLEMAEKLKYIDSNEEARKKREEKVLSFLSELETDTVKALEQRIRQKAIERRIFLAKYRIKREKHKEEMPQFPCNAYMLYVKSLVRGEGDAKDFIRGAAYKWKMLAEDDKQKFRDEAKELTKQYKKDLKAWEARMIVAGKHSLVRKGTKKAVDRLYVDKNRIYEKRVKSLEKARRKRAKSRSLFVAASLSGEKKKSSGELQLEKKAKKAKAPKPKAVEVEVEDVIENPPPSSEPKPVS